MNRPRLSVCIPTYNFGRFIGETLDSIIPQATEEVEILVVDGASTDDTAAVVEQRRRLFPALRYHRLERRGGIDRDMSACLDLAEGEYCWLFSADDLMAPGGISRVLEEIGKQEVDVYLCGKMVCDFHMKPLHEHPIFSVPGDAVYDLGNLSDRAEFFRRAVTSTAFFSFMSSLVVRRAKLSAIPLEEQFIGSCWAHVVRIFRMIPAGLRVKFLSGPLLLKRTGNDSFLDRGIVHRIGITIDGFDRISAAIFGASSTEAFHMRRVLRNEYTVSALLYAKMRASENHPEENLDDLNRLVGILYGDPDPGARLRLWIYRATPYWVLKSVHGFVKALQR